jgi:hypothetical protein
MKSRFLNLCVALLALVALAPAASATCMDSCTAQITLKDCTVPVGAFIGMGTLTFTASCETCCSAPGGPVTCDPLTPTPDMFTVHDLAGQVTGDMTDSGITCEGQTVFEFNTTLLPGSYDLVQGALMILSFEVLDVVNCNTDADCLTCEACVQGSCMGLGLVECTQDGECGVDEYCVVFEGMTCKNHCAANACLTVVCEATCDNFLNPCEAGFECVEPFKGCCGQCEPIGTPCATDQDCEPCNVCVAGECEGLGLIECQTDDDCGLDEHCMVYLDLPCANRCASNECFVVDCFPTESSCDPVYHDCGAGMECVEPIKGCCGQCQAVNTCVTDADCSQCDACVNGQCEPQFVQECQGDLDCAEGEYCIVYDDQPCGNRCASQECWLVDCLFECDPVAAPCGDGAMCVEPIKGCCGTCEPLVPPCQTDEDCGLCQVCVAGKCEGTGVLECTTDDDCLAGYYCLVNQEEPCKNACAEIPPVDQHEEVIEPDVQPEPQEEVTQPDNVQPELEPDVAQPDNPEPGTDDFQAGEAQPEAGAETVAEQEEGGGGGGCVVGGVTSGSLSSLALLLAALAGMARSRRRD